MPDVSRREALGGSAAVVLLIVQEMRAWFNDMRKSQDEDEIVDACHVLLKLQQEEYDAQDAPSGSR